MLRLTLTVLLLSMPALAGAAPAGQAKTKGTILPVSKAQPVQIQHAPLTTPLKVPKLTTQLPKRTTRTVATSTSASKLQTHLPIRTRTVRVLRERPITAPHALRSLGLQLELHLMQESLK